MEKIKKYLIFPVAVLLMEVFLQFNKSFPTTFEKLQNHFATAFPSILLELLAVLAYVFGMSLLFTWMFVDKSLKPFCTGTTYARGATAFVIYYVVIIASHYLAQSIGIRFFMEDKLSWVYVILQSLSNTIIPFFLLFLTIWLVLNPKKYGFTFLKKPFIWAILLCLALNILFILADTQINVLIYTAVANNTELPGLLYNLKPMIMTNQSVYLLHAVAAVIFAIQDIIVLTFINACIKQKPSAAVRTDHAE